MKFKTKTVTFIWRDAPLIESWMTTDEIQTHAWKQCLLKKLKSVSLVHIGWRERQREERKGQLRRQRVNGTETRQGEIGSYPYVKNCIGTLPFQLNGRNWLDRTTERQSMMYTWRAGVKRKRKRKATRVAIRLNFIIIYMI